MKFLPSRARRAHLRATAFPLFHGTRYMSRILADDEIGRDKTVGAVSLTRCPDAAAHHADNGPRDWDDGRGAIIILDRRRLAASFELVAFDEQSWERRTEAEEYVGRAVAPLSRFAVGYVWLDQLTDPHRRVEPRRPRGDPYSPARRARRATYRDLLACLPVHELAPVTRTAWRALEAELSRPLLQELELDRDQLRPCAK